MIKHITKKDTRYHVIYWDTKSGCYTEKNCEKNHKCKGDRK